MAKKRAKKRAKKSMMSECKSYCTTSNSGGGAYCLGFIGALIYYISTSTGFWNGVLGVLKALVWPAFLVFELLKSVAA
jgi:hypothetical protein